MTRRLPVSAPGVLGTLILNGFFAALFVGSALLFRYAAREQPRGRGAGGRAGGLTRSYVRENQA